MSVEEAQGIATEALLQLSRDPEQIGRFLAFSGIGPEMIREAAGEPGFLAGVLEFYMMDEALLLAFCENAGIRPTMMAAARYAIAGGDEDYA
ncbi:hypothetical protein SIAM614_11693 [Stappia aggregata IAM 12614]|uniref:DUF3572 family protein n=1 Tax=Roseibium aggregatum (strain ATCC 25650 / DSM 13394 / JCM 20685 / NBRC 16684 / NCIMB 2208 / IAM 12614 / B1) TaxID=384765 RepID=A0NTM6_ROSAI|nr:DUF3572 domain-containing protein [Roseibium aggregatum]EAV43785.1 hypothetical protein SIAM614_11693 [Stappia aggregata IAM 12614] [Roseibium aggregatum IAM 12614]